MTWWHKELCRLHPCWLISSLTCGTRRVNTNVLILESYCLPTSLAFYHFRINRYPAWAVHEKQDSIFSYHFCIIFLSIFYTSNLYWWGKGWPVDGLPFPDTGCPVPDVSIYYMSNINELPDGILFHWFCKCTPPWMFLPLDIPSEYRPEHVTFGLVCVIFKFPSRIFCRRVPGFATDCPCGVWCRGLTTCLLYVGPPLEF